MKRTHRPIVILTFAVFLSFLIWNAPLREGVRSGLSLCFSSLITALFPFSVLTNVLMNCGGGITDGPRAEKRMKRLFRLPGETEPAVLLGLLGGFPLGAMIASDLCEKGRLTQEEAERTAALSNNAGPAFVIGAVGAGVFGSVRIGAALFLIQASSAMLCGILLRRDFNGKKVIKHSAAPKTLLFSAAFSDALGKSAFSMLRICAIVVFFSALSSLLRAVLPLNRLPAVVYACIYGALELTGGCFALTGIREELAFRAAAAMLGWGGFCVHMQAMDAFSRAGISPLPYLRRKGLQALLCYALSFPVGSLLYGGIRLRYFMFSGVFFAFLIIFFLFFQKQDWKSGGNMV
jgi:sporulation integral membrane protein YlbJ